MKLWLPILIAFSCWLGDSVASAQALSCHQVFNLDTTEASAFQVRRTRKEYWLISRSQLIKTQEVIFSRANVRRDQVVMDLVSHDTEGRILIDRDFKQTLRNSRGVEVPLERFLVVREQIKRSLMKRLGLEDYLAQEMAMRIEKDIVEAADLKWSDYTSVLKKELTLRNSTARWKGLSLKTMAKAMERIDQITIRDFDHDIPYVAGYADKNGRYMYFDRTLPRAALAKGGQKLRIESYLNVHEATEKTLIDELGLRYFEAHQIALRQEKAAVEADGQSWKVYDDFLQSEIKRIYEKPITKAPADLDMTPYIDYQDVDVIEAMKATY